jgi:hypothetical protein
MEKKYCKLKMKWLPFLAVCTFLCMGINVSAQIIAVGNEFLGQWSFDHAQAQERAMNTQGNYTSRIVSLEELQNEIYFEHAPMHFTFMEDEVMHVVTPFGVREGTATIDLYNHYLEIREVIETIVTVGAEGEEDAVELIYGLTGVYTNFQINSTQMSLQFLYAYQYDEGQFMEGILTIYYKR